MGLKFADSYSLLHFAVGVIFYFFNIDLFTSVIVHIIFEFLENTETGMKFINNYLPFWPGGKPYKDSIINSIGDTVFFVLGWLMAYIINKNSNFQK